jgi:DNA gyrase subunit A
LIEKFRLSKLQAQAILDMKMQQLTGLERKKIATNILKLSKRLKSLNQFLQTQEKF